MMETILASLVRLLALTLWVSVAFGGTLDEESLIERPRYLFRGWNAKSGGANEASTGIQLNSATGIVPHAFLQNQQPTHLFKHDNYKGIIEDHIYEEPVISPCSSWATDLQTAIAWAQTHEHSQIAIIDTSLLESYNQIYYVPTLARFGIVDGAAGQLATDEYLIYGPVRAPAFHSVSVRQLMKLGVDTKGKEGSVTEEMVKSVLQAAALFQSPFAKSKKDPNAIISFFAAEIARRVQQANIITKHTKSPKTKWSTSELAIIIKYCRHLLDASHPGTRFVNPVMPTAGFPQVALAQELLLQLEKETKG